MSKINWKKFVYEDPWAYFNLPPKEEKRLRLEFTIKVGPGKIAQLVDALLLDLSYEDPRGNPGKVIHGIGGPEQIAAGTLYAIADFIGQYHKLGRRYKVPLLPEEIMPIFRYPYNQFRDMNFKAQQAVAKRLNKKHKRGLQINGI